MWPLWSSTPGSVSGYWSTVVCFLLAEIEEQTFYCPEKRFIVNNCGRQEALFCFLEVFTDRRQFARILSSWWNSWPLTVFTMILSESNPTGSQCTSGFCLMIMQEFKKIPLVCDVGCGYGYVLSAVHVWRSRGHISIVSSRINLG